MAHSTPKNHDKIERLQGDRVLNPHPQNVSDPLFRDPSREFFDPHDLLQVKYEMLRSVEKEGRPVSEAAKRFGFSRPCFYQARAAFEKHGLAGLIRAHPGPKSARKLTDEVMEFIEQHVKEGEPLRSRVLTPKIQERFGIEIHPRSIERAVKRRKKKSGPKQESQHARAGNKQLALGVGDEITRQYEVLRSHVLAGDSDSILSQRNLSVGILIRQGLRRWLTIWQRCDKDSEGSGLVCEKATDSGSETRLSCARDSEIRSILVNMTLEHVKHSRTQVSGATLLVR